MPFNGSGAFSRVYNWVTDKNNAITITASRMDTEMDGMATALSACVLKDGTQTVTANLPMAGFIHTGVGNASARTHYAVVGQIQDSSYNWIAGGGTADAITATYSPAVTALVDGMLLSARATAANATTTPTFAPNGLTARTITRQGGSALAAGDIPGNLSEQMYRYNLANTRWELLNPSSSRLVIGTTTNDSAAAGSVGEFTSSSISSASAVSLTTQTAKTVTSISLTAGDWDVEGIVWFAPAASTNTVSNIAAISLTNNTLPSLTDGTTAVTFDSFSAVVAGFWTYPTGTLRVSISGTTTVYLIAQSSFTVSTETAYGTIRARRVR